MKSPSTLLVVQDIDISCEFYTKVLGLEFIETHQDCIKLKTGEHEVIIFQGTGAAVQYDHGYHANSTLLFTVDDLDSKIAELKSKGIAFIHDTPNQNRWGRYAAFRDPSGIVHELFELNT
ncbi:VOC family protein [Thalassomonas actiniarum]|uniref:VOC family protein n=1 Tax=Thalassomonas actiniarum TaxID=485447 RepID=A0AAF0C234_9GAMM|nr:VOC family protein [Thalassomonas actiniarum]WDD98077.1 VOC family protein [Thalassomonas actiniarum]